MLQGTLPSQAQAAALPEHGTHVPTASCADQEQTAATAEKMHELRQ